MKNDEKARKYAPKAPDNAQSSQSSQSSQSAAFDKLDGLIRSSCSSLLDEELEEFRSARGELTVSKKTDRSILHMIRKHFRAERFARYKRPLKIAAIAAALTVILLLVACVSIPTVRKALWKAVAEWRGEYIAIRFVPNDDSEVGTDGTGTGALTSGVSDTVTVTPVIRPEVPKSIEQINVPGYIPEGYRTEATDMISMYTVVYYKGDEYVCFFTQMIFSADIMVDSTDATVSNISINGASATLVSYEYEDDPDNYALIWSDDKYVYLLEGVFHDQKEMLKIAASVELLYFDGTETTGGKPTDPPRVDPAPPKTVEQFNPPLYAPENYTYEDSISAGECSRWYYAPEGDEIVYVFSQFAFSAIDSINIDSEYINMTEYKANGLTFSIYAYEDDLYNIVWSDSKYAYYITGEIESYDVLMIILGSVIAL